MNLNDTNWSDFKISDIFPIIEYGKNSYAVDLEDGHDCIYVGAKKDENGFMKWCKRDNSLISKGNCIVFIVDGKGSVGYCNYMDRDFIATANLKLGYCKELNQYTGLFIATIAGKERFRYSFGRKWKKFVKDTIISLPSRINNESKLVPDWQFMEDYIKSLHYKPITTNNSKYCLNLNIEEWKEYDLNTIFSVKGSKTASIDELESIGYGKYPYVTTQAVNNGVEGFYNHYTEEGECLTVDSAVLGYCSFRDMNFSASDHVEILRPKFKFNKYIAMFIVTILNKEQYRYSYGRKCSQVKLKQTKIKLPSITNDDGTYSPDFEFMEDYIKSLPYGDRL